jgi:hypothetical protein
VTSTTRPAPTHATVAVTAARLPAPIEVPGLVVVDDDVVPDAMLTALRRELAGSRLLGSSQLGGGFSATRGFGVACHARAVDDAVARVPALGPFVDVALDDALLARLLRPNALERAALALFGAVNALYLNVLVVPPGAEVGRHVDATLGVATARPGDRDAPRAPRAVCVVYVDVPADLQGGLLRLFHGGPTDDGDDAPLAVVAPRAGRLVLFRGGLGHEVTRTASASSACRVSCVAELYALPAGRLRRLPRVRLQSHGFAAVLERLRGPPAPG